MKKRSFTLVEILVAMVVFSLFMLGMIQFFSTTQQLMSNAKNKIDRFERARIVNDMIASDLQCLYYEPGTDKKIFLAPDLTKTDLSDSSAGDQVFRLASVRKDSLPGANTTLTSVSYEFFSDAMALKTIAFGDNDTNEWLLTVETDQPTVSKTNNAFIYAVPSGSARKYSTISEGVVDFKITCYEYDNGELSEMNPDTTIYSTLAKAKRLPDAVNIQLTLIDLDTLNRIKNFLGGTENSTLDLSTATATQKTKIDEWIDENKMTFNRLISIDRGQL